MRRCVNCADWKEESEFNGLRNFLRLLRAVPKKYLSGDVVVHECIVGPKDYHQHQSFVQGSLSDCYKARGRYIGLKKHNIQAILSVCAANLKRTAHWLSGERSQVRPKKTWTLNPA